MEPTMISLRVSSTAAAMALVLAMAAPSTSFAQAIGRGAPAGGVHISGGGGGFRGGGGGGAPVARFGGGGGWQRGGGDWHGGHRHDGGFIPGAVAGALIGGAIASQGYGYYGGPGYYYAPGYYDDQYYDDGAVAPAPVGDDAVTYCMQTYRSYDPESGTYLGFDGLRHPCP
jgi:hypothetical protein